jgi:membrane associated rhomboid family serine protease
MVTGVGAGIIQLIVAYIRLIPIYNLLSPEELDFVITNGYDLIHGGQGPAIFLNNPNVIDAIFLINSTTVGASGSVFGILLAFGMLFPNTELMLLFPPIPIKAKWFVIFYGAFELYSGFANNPNDNVAHFAHLGGMLFGFILIKIWKKDRGNFY